MSKSKPVIWEADPHTIAKISILEGYLNAWFRILGKSRRGQIIHYVDGFAGPGYYRNHDEGSPLVALRVAECTISSLGKDFIAKGIHCAFFESHKDRFRALEMAVAPFLGKQRLRVKPMCCEFRDGIEALRSEFPDPFEDNGPLFVFADPFGGTGIPFKTVADCMQSEVAELLINLDADGIGRMFAADNNKNRDAQLTELFGSECWRRELGSVADFKVLTVKILDLYVDRLRTLPGVKFTWSFAMRGKNDALSYFLVFASKHPLGMEKMKEAMRAIDETGSFSFSDAHTGQAVLLRDDDPVAHAQNLFRAFEGKTATMEEVHFFALIKTPFLNAKAMLSILENDGKLQVETRGAQKRRVGSFPEAKVVALRFGKFAEIGKQGELGI